MIKHSDALGTSSMQFGFKAEHSTCQCTFVLQEVVDFYVSRKSSCYAVLLDASKAFDRVHYVKLFKLLLDKGMCPLVAKLLVCMYTKQQLIVKWGEQNL